MLLQQLVMTYNSHKDEKKVDSAQQKPSKKGGWKAAIFLLCKNTSSLIGLYVRLSTLSIFTFFCLQSLPQQSDFRSLACLQTSSHTSQMNFINLHPQRLRMSKYGLAYPISSLCFQPLQPIPSWEGSKQLFWLVSFILW